jgi:glycogen operon protein
MPQYTNDDDTSFTTYPGSPHPLGAYYDGHGINFALYSEFATKVQLCLFRKNDNDFVEYTRINVKG